MRCLNTVLTIFVLCHFIFLNVLSLDFNYHDQEELEIFLKNISDFYPHITNLYSIGTTHEGNELWVLEIKANKGSGYGIPNVKLIGNIHGNEVVGREVLLHLIDFLVVAYDNNDPFVRWLLENTKIHILPSLNPDGFARAQEAACTGVRGRSNANHVDLNRSFPDFFQPNPIQSQRETLAVINWLKQRHFVLSASLHGGALVANYPYENHSKNDMRLIGISPDDDVFKHIATVYAQTHPEMHKGLPCSPSDKRFPGGIVNGVEWYPLTGGMQDYNYIYHGCLELTLEISCCKYPMKKHLRKMWQANKYALLNYTKQVHYGVKGMIRNVYNQTVANAKLKIINRDVVPFNATSAGEFWRILLPGVYHLQINATNYDSQIIEFQVENRQSSRNFPKPTELLIIMLKTTMAMSTIASNEIPDVTISELSTAVEYQISTKNSMDYSINSSSVNTSYSIINFIMSFIIILFLFV